MSVIPTHYARITAAASGVPKAMLFGKFLHCQANQVRLTGCFSRQFFRVQPYSARLRSLKRAGTVSEQGLAAIQSAATNTLINASLIISLRDILLRL